MAREFQSTEGNLGGKILDIVQDRVEPITPLIYAVGAVIYVAERIQVEAANLLDILNQSLPRKH